MVRIMTGEPGTNFIKEKQIKNAKDTNDTKKNLGWRTGTD
jgi:hypothetical protein